MKGLDVRLIEKLTFIAPLAAACLSSGPAVRAAVVSDAAIAAQVQSPAAKDCPSPAALEAVLAQASSWMEQSRFQDAAGMLQSIAARNCDARISLLLAAAFEGQGDMP